MVNVPRLSAAVWDVDHLVDGQRPESLLRGVDRDVCLGPGRSLPVPALARRAGGFGDQTAAQRLRLHKHSLCAILAFLQVTTSAQLTSDGPPDGGARPDDLACDLYALVVFLHKNCNADLFAAMGLLEMSITQIKLLHLLEEVDHEVTLKEAAESLPLSLPATSRTVDDLVRRGMLERHEDHEDRRMKRISLTETGRSVSRRLNAARLSGLGQFTQTLGEEERNSLSRALAALLQRTDIAVCRPEGPLLT
jgi:DNA-binding MarR family transcriptional regulator